MHLWDAGSKAAAGVEAKDGSALLRIGSRVGDKQLAAGKGGGAMRAPVMSAQRAFCQHPHGALPWQRPAAGLQFWTFILFGPRWPGSSLR